MRSNFWEFEKTRTNSVVLKIYQLINYVVNQNKYQIKYYILQYFKRMSTTITECKKLLSSDIEGFQNPDFKHAEYIVEFLPYIKSGNVLNLIYYKLNI